MSKMQYVLGVEKKDSLIKFKTLESKETAHMNGNLHFTCIIIVKTKCGKWLLIDNSPRSYAKGKKQPDAIYNTIGGHADDNDMDLIGHEISFESKELDVDNNSTHKLIMKLALRELSEELWIRTDESEATNWLEQWNDVGEKLDDLIPVKEFPITPTFLGFVHHQNQNGVVNNHEVSAIFEAKLNMDETEVKKLAAADDYLTEDGQKKRIHLDIVTLTKYEVEIILPKCLDGITRLFKDEKNSEILDKLYERYILDTNEYTFPCYECVHWDHSAGDCFRVSCPKNDFKYKI